MPLTRWRVSRYQDAIEEIRNRQALLAQRRSELSLARQQLADTAVYAPLDGVVQEKRASVGEYLAAGAPVVNIVRMDPLRLRAEVPERDARNVRSGQNVRVTIDGDTNVYVGQIMRLSPVIAQQTRMLMVEADVRNNGKLRPGAFARAEIVTDDAKMAVTVPNKAIVTFAGIEKVILVQNGKALEKPVTTGRRNGEWTEIVAGDKRRRSGGCRSGQPAIGPGSRSGGVICALFLVLCLGALIFACVRLGFKPTLAKLHRSTEHKVQRTKNNELFYDAKTR